MKLLTSTFVRRFALTALSVLAAIAGIAGCSTARIEINVDKVMARPMSKVLVMQIRDATKESAEIAALKNEFSEKLVSEFQAACLPFSSIVVTVPELDPGLGLRRAVEMSKPSELLKVELDASLSNGYGYLEAISILLTQSNLREGRELWKARIYIPARNRDALSKGIRDLISRMQEERILQTMCKG